MGWPEKNIAQFQQDMIWAGNKIKKANFYVLFNAAE